MPPSQGGKIGGLAGAVVGGTLGFFVGGPAGIMMGASLGASLGGMVGNLVDPPNPDLPNVQGPMEATVNTMHRNLPVPIVYGVCKVGGNVIWMGNIRTSVQESGGGKGKPVQRKVFYHADWAIALSEGTIQGVGRIWINEQEPEYTRLMGKEAAWTADSSQTLIAIEDGGTVAMTLGEDAIQVDISGFAGGPLQIAPSLIYNHHNGDNPPGHRATGYLLVSGRLGQMPQIPNISAEVAGINTTITPLPLTISVIFTRWQLRSEWTENAEGSFSKLATEWLFWFNSVTLGASLTAYHWATNVHQDFSKDFDLKFILGGNISVLNNAVLYNGLAIKRRDTLATVMYVTLYMSGFVDSGGGYQSALKFNVQGNQTSKILFQEGPPAPAGEVRIETVYIRVEKRGEWIRIYYARAGEPWTLGVEHAIAEATALSFGACTLAVYSEGEVGDPTVYIDDIYFKYFSTVPVSLASSANPVLCVYDFLRNVRYGCGYPESILDIASFAEEAAFCDEDLESFISEDADSAPDVHPSRAVIPEPQADGTGERRFRLDIPLTERKNALAHLDDMLATFRGFLVPNINGTIGIRIEKKEPLDDVQHFSDEPTHLREGIVQDTFEFSEISSRDRPNRVKVEFVRGDDGYRRDFVVANDEYDQEIRGEIVEKVHTLIGIKRQSQANRMVQYFQDYATHVRYVCSFRVGIAALRSQAGDLITVSHTVPNWDHKAFRILKITEEPEEELTLNCIEYVPEIYHDKEAPAILDATPILAEDAFTDPPNALRVRAFEPRDDALPRLYVTWSLDPAFSFYVESFVFRQRETEGTFEGQGTHAVNSSTAYLTSVRMGYAAAIAVDAGVPAGTLRIANATGLLAQVYDSDNNLVDEAAASGATIDLDVSGEANPFNGYVILYAGASYTAPLYRGRYPRTGSASLPHESLLTWVEEIATPAENPTSLLLCEILGTFPDGGDAQVEDAECSYTDFVEDVDGDRLTGVTWPLEPEAVTPDPRITDLKVYSKESGSHVDHTASYTNAATMSIIMLPSNGDELYIGSATKRLAQLIIQLAVAASHDNVLTFSYPTDPAGGASNYASFERITDGTAGLTQSGAIAIEPPIDWVASAKDAAANTIGDGVARYYLRIRRNASTVTTRARERRIYPTADHVVTLQEANNRMDYFYSGDDLNQTLTFEVLTQAVSGATADTDRVPIDEIEIQQYTAKPLAPANLQIDDQGGSGVFLGGDLVLNWAYVSRTIGAGRIHAGEYVDGAGGGRTDAGFQGYVVRIYDAEENLVRSARVTDDGSLLGTYTYTEEDRISDGIGLTLSIEIYQEANNLLSPPAALAIVAGTVSTSLSLENLVGGFGHQYVPAMSGITSLADLPGVSSLSPPFTEE